MGLSPLDLYLPSLKFASMCLPPLEQNPETYPEPYHQSFLLYSSYCSRSSRGFGKFEEPGTNVNSVLRGLRWFSRVEL